MDRATETVPPALGEFRISAVLGRGGSGIVYDAQWGPRRVALKVLHEELAGTERVRSQFLTEARALQTLQHPGIVKVLGVGELPDGRPYLAMEHLAGETLASVLARGPLPLATAIARFEELCEAVGALHAQGLIHRDLKPENVFVVDGEHAVLLDLGIAKEAAAPSSTTTMEGGVRGTPAYMAPERFFGQPAGIATDLYELAVTLYAMLAGRLPWDDLGDPEARLSPRALVEIAPHVPAELDVEIRRALSTRAQNRPPSAAALRAAVRAALGSAASEPSPASTARMKSGVDPRPTVTAQPGWFAQRQQTTDRGKTPLAWAPADAPPQPPPPPPKQRWPYVAGGLAVAAIAGGVAWWRLAGDEPAPRTVAASTLVTADAATLTKDPWGTRVETPTPPDAAPKSIAATGESLSIEVAREQIAHAITRVPADTRFVFTANVAELRADSQFDAVLGKLANNIQVKALLAMAPCLQPILAGSEWVVFGTQSLQDPERGTLVIGGRWQRGDLETCLADDMERLKMPDGKTMLQLRRVGWLDFIDDHTVYISVREDLAAAQVHALVKNGSGGTKQLKALVAKLPADRTVGAVIDGSGKMKWPKDTLPDGSDAIAWFSIADDGWTMFDLAVDTRDEVKTLKLVEKVRAEVDPVFANADAKRAGTIDVSREKTTLRVKGKLSPFITGMLSTMVP